MGRVGPASHTPLCRLKHVQVCFQDVEQLTTTLFVITLPFYLLTVFVSLQNEISFGLHYILAAIISFVVVLWFRVVSCKGKLMLFALTFFPLIWIWVPHLLLLLLC
jgi:hypothetical protein